MESLLALRELSLQGRTRTAWGTVEVTTADSRRRGWGGTLGEGAPGELCVSRGLKRRGASLADLGEEHPRGPPAGAAWMLQPPTHTPREVGMTS